MRIIVAAAIAFFLTSAGLAKAEAWPTRAVTMVVPYAAGGPVDTIGRILAARLSEILGQQVVIENAGGAGGMTGASRVAKAQLTRSESARLSTRAFSCSTSDASSLGAASD